MAIYEFILALIAYITSMLPAPTPTATVAAPPPVVATPAPVAAAPAAPVYAAPLAIPDGVTQITDDSGCLGTYCPYGAQRANFYSPSRRTILVAEGQRASTVQHEWCHAHQHYTVLQELGREPGEDLSEWYQTREGAFWVEQTGSLPFGWERLSAPTPLETFATVCGYYYTNPEALRSADPARFDAFEAIAFGTY